VMNSTFCSFLLVEVLLVAEPVVSPPRLTL